MPNKENQKWFQDHEEIDSDALTSNVWVWFLNNC